MKKWMTTMALLLWGVAAMAQNPAEVAESFWRSMQKGDKTAAKALTVRGHVETGLPVEVAIDGVSVGEANATDGLATVPTRILFHVAMKGERSVECNASFATELLCIDGAWKVDGIVTMQNYLEGLESGALACSGRLVDLWLQKSQQAFEKYRKSLEKSGREMSATMRQMLLELERQMLEALEELEKRTPPKSPEPALPSLDEGERI